MNDVAAQLLAYMNTHHQIRREANLHRAMQTAIADELRARYEPPSELTRELSGVIIKLIDPKEPVPLRNGGLKLKAPAGTAKRSPLRR
jgi:hypothetical protein